MCNLTTNFNFDNNQVRTLLINNKPYFVGYDVAEALGYSKPRNAISTHCKGALKQGVLTDGGKQEMLVIPEGDVFRLIIKSKLEKAQKFESWVMDEVLPTLRKTGSYSLNNKDTYTYYTSDLISKDLTNLDIVRMDDNYNKERPCYWCPTICTCGHCGIAKHLQVDQKNSLNLHCIFEKMIRSEINKNYKQYDLLHKVIYDLVKTNRQIDWELGFNWDFLQRICDLAFIGYKAKYKYDTINNKPEEVKKRLCMA